MGGWGLAVSAAGLWTGILLAGAGAAGRGYGPSLALLAGGIVGLAGGLAGLRGLRRPVVAAVVGISFCSLGAGWEVLHAHRIDSSPASSLAGRSVRVWGSLESDPEPRPDGWTASLRTSVLFPSTAGWPQAVRTSSLLWVRGYGEPPPLQGGDRVEAGGYLERAEGDFGRFLGQRGYAASFSTREVRYRGPPMNPLLRMAGLARRDLRDSLLRVFPDREAGLVMGLALGDTSRLDPGIVEDFRATGLTHLVAVSGANVALFLAPVLGLATLAGLGMRGRLVVGLAAVAFFVVLTRAEPSVLRAGAMAGLGLFGIFLGRPRSPPAALGGSVLGLLAADPTLAFAVGFQLSVAATAGMMLMAGPIATRLAFLPRGVALAAGATLGAQAGVMPLLLHHFGLVPSVTLPANLLAFPAVGAAMLGGLAAGLLGLASVTLGTIVAAPARLPLVYLAGVADRMARAPLPSVTSEGGDVASLLVGLAVVVAGGWWLRSGRRPPRTALRVALLVLPILLWAGAIRAGPPSTVTVTFFDVGQGDAALLRSPAGAAVLVDGGPDPYVVARKLAALGVRRLDGLVATHPHADHVEGLPAVLGRFRVAVVLDPGCGGESPSYEAFVQAVDDAGVPVRHPREGARLRVSDLDLEVLGPPRCHAGTDSDANNDSIVLRVAGAAASVLFPGDAEEPAQAELLEDAGAGLGALVLKVPHHGGATSLPAFFEAVAAPVAVVSVGQPNRYGHPAPEVLHALRASGSRVFRTDLLGDVTVRFAGGRLLIESSRG